MPLWSIYDFVGYFKLAHGDAVKRDYMKGSSLGLSEQTDLLGPSAAPL
jgi:hypothetical protein